MGRSCQKADQVDNNTAKINYHESVINNQGNMLLYHESVVNNQGNMLLRHHDLINNLENRTTTVEGRATALEGRTTTLEENVGALQGRAVQVENRAGVSESKIAALEAILKETDGMVPIPDGVNDVDALRAELTAEKAENALLTGRVQELERQQNISNEKIEKLQNQLAELMQTVTHMNQGWRNMAGRIDGVVETTGVWFNQFSERLDQLSTRSTAAIAGQANPAMRRRSLGFTLEEIREALHN